MKFLNIIKGTACFVLSGCFPYVFLNKEFALALAPDAKNKHIRLLRLDKPIGSYLLAMPAFISLAAYAQAFDIAFWLYMFCAIGGGIIMRTSGCIINDIVDRDLDASIIRTKNRPLASGDISLFTAVMWLIALLGAGIFILLIAVPANAAFAMVASAPLILIYPFAKRFMSMPQLFLAALFSWGVWFGPFVYLGHFDFNVIILYVAIALQVFTYDTIYASQDYEGDVAAKVGSAAIALRGHIKELILLMAVVSSVLFLLFLQKMGDLDILSLVFTLLAFAAMVWQAFYFDEKDNRKSMLLFKYAGCYQFLMLIAVML